MRVVFRLWLVALVFVAILPPAASAQEVTSFESPEQGIAFAYPLDWALAGESRGVLPNEVFVARAQADSATAFAVAVYQLPTPLGADNLDALLDQQDQQLLAWIKQLPGGRVLEAYDITVDQAEGREYLYEFEAAGQLLQADTSVVLHGDKAVEISQWAPRAEYPERTATFDQIFGSLVLPWTPAPSVPGS